MNHEHVNVDLVNHEHVNVDLRDVWFSDVFLPRGHYGELKKGIMIYGNASIQSPFFRLRILVASRLTAQDHSTSP